MVSPSRILLHKHCLNSFRPAAQSKELSFVKERRSVPHCRTTPRCRAMLDASDVSLKQRCWMDRRTTISADDAKGAVT